MRQIAIDGPAGAGKSTIAKALAKDLGFMYVDTGAMYRAVALACIENGCDLNDEAKISEICGRANVEVKYEDRVQQMYLDGKDVNAEIRKENVGNAASAVSRFLPVREKLVSIQQKIASEYDVVMDGRDIGTKVLPLAELKIFLTASSDVRAMRRFKELKDKGETPDFSDIKADIENRDLQDSTRAVSPLVKADDAVEIDSSDMSIEEVSGAIKALYKERGQNISKTGDICR